MKENITPRLPTLYNRCLNLHQEITALSDLSEDALADAYLELGECLSYWHSGHEYLSVEDPYDGLNLMMREGKMPWPAMEFSNLNGLKLSQFLLAFAYGEVERALRVLATRPVKGTRAMSQFDSDDAACFALYAAKAVVHAKQIMASGQDRQAQRAHGRKAA